MKTAAVIGSGPNGLSAAVTLARAGVEVEVFERSAKVGGSATTAELTLPGFHHDVCSAIHPMAPDSPAFEGLELQDHGLQWLHSPAALTHPMDDGCAVLWRDLDQTVEGLGMDGKAWRGMCQPFVRRWAEFSRDAMAPAGVPSNPFLMARFGLKALQSADGFARSQFRSERARALFAGIAAHSVLPLRNAGSSPIGLMLTYAAHAGGWPFPRGGAQAISTALASVLRANGGVVHVNAHVDDIAGLAHDAVFFCTSPVAMADICGDALPSAFGDRLRKYKHGPGIFKCDWAVSDPVPWRHPEVAQSACVHLGGTLDDLEASERAPWEGRHAERPFVLLAQNSLFDSTRAPAGKHVVWAYCHVPSGSDRDMRAVIEAEIERHAPGFRDTILACATRNAQQVQQHNPNYIGGDVNGGAAVWDQLFTRPVARLDPYSTPNAKVWICSAASPPGGGVHGLGGWFAAKSALRKLRQ